MTAKPQRRTQEQRSADARELLSRAAFELIRDNGYASFRVAAVAKHAGVSQGGQLHHFPTKNAMTMAAIEYAINAARSRTEQNLAAFKPGADLITAIIEDSMEYYFSPNFDVAMDITRSMSHDEELRRAIASAHRNYRAFAEGSWLERLTSGGWAVDDARDLIELTTSLARGFAIRAMIRPDTATFERLTRRWHDIAAEYFPPTSDKGSVSRSAHDR